MESVKNTGADGDVTAPVMTRGFFTSDDGADLYTYLDSLFVGPLGRAIGAASIRIEAIETCLVNIVNGTDATLWVNPAVKLAIIPKTSVQAGTVAYLDDVADVRSVEFPGVEMPSKGAVIYTFQHRWRRGLYFDFPMYGPHGSEANRPLKDLGALFGSYHAALMLRERIRMEPDVLEKMFAAGWFPFVRLPQDLAVSIYRHFEQGWDHASVEDEIVRTLRSSITQFATRWSSRPQFAPHMTTLNEAVRHYENGEYMATSALLLPKVEGILRALNLDPTRTTARDLRENVARRVRASVTGVTAYLPEAFVRYLEVFHFASFDPNASVAPASRHAFLHGVGPDAEMAKPSYPLRLLLTIDQLFFYA